jgi:hypothetical protein
MFAFLCASLYVYFLHLDCDDPTPAFSNTTVRAIRIGSIVFITCIKGYEINGSAAIACQENGTWSDRPTCRPVGG